MAITLFHGPPGAGKSHALVKDVILPAVMAGRRVLTNIDGINPDAIRGYCLTRLEGTDRHADTLGEVVPFHGEQMLVAGFFPDESTEAAGQDTFVKGGDLLVIDEWALYFPKRGKWPTGCNVAAFLRWHRHMTGANGQATDVAIGSQIPADVHLDVRALIQRSYKFKKLTALGAAGSYSWLVFDGHLTAKGTHFNNGTGKYDPEVFPLYASSSAAKDGTHVELKTNKRDSIWGGWKAKAVVASVPLLIILGGFGVSRSWSALGGHPASEAGEPDPQGEASSGAPARPSPPPRPPSSPWRIVGVIDGDTGKRVILADEKGSVRMAMPDAFRFQDDRPISGTVDGLEAVAQDALPAVPQQFGSILQ